jgi:hypothetical protein
MYWETRSPCKTIPLTDKGTQLYQSLQSLGKITLCGARVGSPIVTVVEGNHNSWCQGRFSAAALQLSACHLQSALTWLELEPVPRDHRGSPVAEENQ